STTDGLHLSSSKDSFTISVVSASEISIACEAIPIPGGFPGFSDFIALTSGQFRNKCPRSPHSKQRPSLSPTPSRSGPSSGFRPQHLTPRKLALRFGASHLNLEPIHFSSTWTGVSVPQSHHCRHPQGRRFGIQIRTEHFLANRRLQAATKHHDFLLVHFQTDGIEDLLPLGLMD
ncbi:unnamed protein product, partial [Mycena citricolor]